jgi:hypothetical protein
MMPRGLAKATNYYNRIAAWEDWERLDYQAETAGHKDLVERYAPPTDAGWRKIDKCIAALRSALEGHPSPSSPPRADGDYR